MGSLSKILNRKVKEINIYRFSELELGMTIRCGDLTTCGDGFDRMGQIFTYGIGNKGNEPF